MREIKCLYLYFVRLNMNIHLLTLSTYTCRNCRYVIFTRARIVSKLNGYISEYIVMTCCKSDHMTEPAF